MVTPIPTDTRSPVKMPGRLAGRSTRRKIVARLAPSDCAAWILRTDTARTACIAEIEIKGNSAAMMTIVFESSPIPNQMMNKGRSASFGIGRVVSIGGSSAARTPLCMPMSNPTGTPTITQTTNAMPKRIRLIRK